MTLQPFLGFINLSSKSGTGYYAPYILTLLLLSLIPLIFVIHLPNFPIRAACFIAGTAPLLFTHPAVLSLSTNPGLRAFIVRPHINLEFCVQFGESVPSWLRSILPSKLKSCLTLPRHREVDARSLVQRLIDNANLSDEHWQTHLREVELWENERYVSPPGEDQNKVNNKASAGWSKTNLRPGERGPWTRGRDGFGEGEVRWVAMHSLLLPPSLQSGANHLYALLHSSSTLTFPLDPGWAFVDTEDWRADYAAAWAADEDGGVGSAADEGMLASFPIATPF